MCGKHVLLILASDGAHLVLQFGCDRCHITTTLWFAHKGHCGTNKVYEFLFDMKKVLQSATEAQKSLYVNSFNYVFNVS